MIALQTYRPHDDLPLTRHTKRTSNPDNRKIPTCARLPIELYRPIIEHVTSSRDLASVARVCRATQVEAERRLYFSIVLHPIAFPRLCWTILTYNRLTHLVKKCELYVQLRLRDGSFSDSPSRNCHDMIRTSRALLARLSRFSRLEELHVQSLMLGTEAKVGRALAACNLHLLKFCSSCPLDDDMLTFLDTQTHIREVIILNSRLYSSDTRNHRIQFQLPKIQTSHASASDSTSANVNPDLTSLKVLTPQAAVCIVPGRSITQLEVLVWDGSCIKSIAAALARSSRPLRSLLVSQGLRLAAGDLSALGQQLPGLRYLGECISDTLSIYTNELHNLSCLETLVINQQCLFSADIHCHDNPSDTRALEYRILQSFSAVSRSLRRVVFTAALLPVRSWERVGTKVWIEVERLPMTLCADLWRDA